ncbi:MAG: hypothetical protein ACLFRY_02270 [Spirochaetia bacterium]
MKQITLVFTLLVVLSLGSVFASGSQEQEEGPWGFRDGYQDEPIELTGRVIFPGYGHLELAAGGETYKLMVPFFLLDKVDIQEGETVTVEGFLVPGPRWSDEDDEKHLAVTKATVDGKEYELSFGRGYMHGRISDDRFNSRGYGPSGRHGPRGGYGHIGPGGCRGRRR